MHSVLPQQPLEWCRQTRPAAFGSRGGPCSMYRSEYRAGSRMDLALCSTKPCGRRIRDVRGDNERKVGKEVMEGEGTQQRHAPGRGKHASFSSRVVLVNISSPSHRGILQHDHAIPQQVQQPPDQTSSWTRRAFLRSIACLLNPPGRLCPDRAVTLESSPPSFRTFRFSAVDC